MTLIFALTAISGSGILAEDARGEDVSKDAPQARIRLEVLEPEERGEAVRDFPVSVGLVFPEGEINSLPGGRLVDGDGEAVPFEAEVTGWWNPEKSRIKWLLLHFKASTDREYYFEVGKKPEAQEGRPIASRDDGAVLVATGPLKLRVPADRPGLFDGVELNGKSMLSPLASSLTLIADDDETQTAGRLTNWEVALEESTPTRASLKATGIYTYPDGKPLARLDLRYQFFKDESFVRLYHTLTWMVKDCRIGAREISLALNPDLGRPGKLRLGLSDYGDAAWEAPWDITTEFFAHQDQGDHFQATAGGEAVTEGERLGGCLSLVGADGRGVSLSLRHAWPTFPTAFAASDGRLQVQFWPDRGPRLSYAPEAIMPPDFYNSRVWKAFWWSKEQGHYMNEYARRRLADGTVRDNDFFLYTAEGSARTHEVVISFHDESTRRTPAQINSVNQHPVVVRQDPASAMRVPFMGFDIMPVNKDKYPNIERAADRLGRMSMARWVSQHNFGHLRFGMVVWGRPLHPNNSLYRWMDNLQYDQQLIPWLLYLRGGARRFYEDGEIASRHAMDICVNHYNTRGYPTGCCATCGGGLPFPFIHFTIWNMKGMKVHYLSYYYHLTGYRRAKEVMDEIIAGTREFTLGLSELPEERHGTAREMYNMNVFWTNAYEETWDPVIGKLCREANDLTVSREYDREYNAFRQPQVYLYNGLVLQHGRWKDPKMRDVMLRDLSADLLPITEEGGIRNVFDSIGCAWAYEQTGDQGYAQAGWEVARSLADLTPDADFASGKPLDGCISGSQLYRHFLMPILVGASLGDRLGLDPQQPTRLNGTFFFLGSGPSRSKEVSLEARVRPRRNGDLKLQAIGRAAPGRPVRVTVTGREGTPVASLSLQSENVSAKGRFYPRNSFWAKALLVLPAAKQGEVYKVAFTGGYGAQVRLAGDADIVYRFPDGSWHATAPLAGGQYYTGTALFAKTTADSVTVRTNDNIFHRPYTIRDAQTGELLHRYSLSDPLESKHELGKDRMIVLLMSGARANRAWQVEGVSPYFATKLEDWFEPDPRNP